jgi:hypothetical protein
VKNPPRSNRKLTQLPDKKLELALLPFPVTGPLKSKRKI